MSFDLSPAFGRPSRRRSLRPAARRRTRIAVEPVEQRLLFATITVLNTDDSGADSLRASIAAANSGDTIDLSGLSGTITLATNIEIDKSLSIVGPSNGGLTISGDDQTTQAFSITGTAVVAMSDLTIDDAGSDHTLGGGLVVWGDDINNRATLSLTRVTLSNNVGTQKGGALYAMYANLTMTDCTVVDNEVSGGDFSMGGGVGTEHTHLVINNSTFARNRAIAVPEANHHDPDMASGSAIGGGVIANGHGNIYIANSTFVDNVIKVSGAATSGTLRGAGVDANSSNNVTLLNNTVVGNEAIADGNSLSSQGGGVWTTYVAGTLVFANNLVAGNTAANGTDVWMSSNLAANVSHSLIARGEGSNVTNGTLGNIVGSGGTPIDAKLGTLASNGGKTQTVALLAGSPAIDAGTATDTPTADQRGLSRVGAADIGAFEVQSNTPDPTPDPTPEPDPEPQPEPTPQPTPGKRFEPVAGKLVLTGTSGDDEIRLWTRGDNREQVRFVINGKIFNFDRALVTAIELDSGDGDDNVTMNVDTLPADTYLGKGNDTYVGNVGNETVGGGSGHDTIHGGGGDDLLRGHGGFDKLLGGDGNDHLYGGDGNDTLDGQNGEDRLWGEAGRDDYLGRGDGNALDRFYGELTGIADGDRAWKDKRDKAYDVILV